MITPNPIVVPMTVSADIETVELLVSSDAENIGLEVNFDIRPGGGGAFPYYEGDYEVTPRLVKQSLGTYHTIMLDNVTVHEIPVTRTSNPQNGWTVLIG